MFKKDCRNWTEFQAFLPAPVEIDFHPVEGEENWMPYHERMAEVYGRALDALESAQAHGVKWVMFTHGSSTSHRGKTTARSQIRSLMRSSDATPFIIRKECFQHYSVFVAAIRPKAQSPVTPSPENP